MKKILIVGGSGFVGTTLIKYLPSSWKIFCTYNTNSISNSNIKSFKINFLNNPNKIVSIIKNIQPDYIIHAMAFTTVDFCEENHNLTDKLHVDSTAIITNTAKKFNSKLIFLSTDAVFKGDKKKYQETDKTCPINYYGVTKLRAEKIVLKSSKRNIVLRTAVIYGKGSKSKFTNWILTYLKQGKMVDPFIDQHNSPTLVDDLAQAIIKILEKNIMGLYHATGPTCTNKYNFAVMLAKEFNLNENLIKPVTSFEKKQVAPRPAATCLDSSQLEHKINFKFKDLKNGIKYIST